MSKLKAILLGVLAVIVLLIIIGLAVGPSVEKEPARVALLIVAGDPRKRHSLQCVCGACG